MAIAQVGGANNNSAVGVQTLTATYTATNGNIVVVFVNVSTAVTGLAVKDNNNVALSAGPVQGNLACFYYTATGGPTSFTATWTTNAQASIAVEEYSGAAAVNTNFSANHNNGTSATATITIPITATNNWIVCGLGSANTITGSVGNQRQQTTASTARVTLMDNTSGSIGNVTCSGTLTSAAWAAVGVELGGAGVTRDDQEVELVVTQPTSANVRDNQDLLMVLTSPTDTRVRVQQEVLLVLIPKARATYRNLFAVT